MSKRSPEDYAAMSRAVENGEYTVEGPIELGAGYRKLAAQSQSDDEKALDADRRARRDRNRALRARKWWPPDHTAEYI